MEQVQYTSSGHTTNIVDANDNSNNNLIAGNSNVNHNLSMRVLSSMMQYRKQSSSIGLSTNDPYSENSRNELKLLRCNALHRPRVRNNWPIFCFNFKRFIYLYGKKLTIFYVSLFSTKRHLGIRGALATHHCACDPISYPNEHVPKAKTVSSLIHIPRWTIVALAEPSPAIPSVSMPWIRTVTQWWTHAIHTQVPIVRVLQVAAVYYPPQHKMVFQRRSIAAKRCRVRLVPNIIGL